MYYPTYIGAKLTEQQLFAFTLLINAEQEYHCAYAENPAESFNFYHPPLINACKIRDNIVYLYYIAVKQYVYSLY